MNVVASPAESPSVLSDMCQIAASSYRPSRRLRDSGAHNCVTIPRPLSLVGVAGFEPATTRTPSVVNGVSDIELRWEIVEFLGYMLLWMTVPYSFVGTTNPAENVRYVSDGKLAPAWVPRLRVLEVSPAL